MTRLAKITVKTVLAVLAIWAIASAAIILLTSPLDDCAEIGGLYVSETESCLCLEDGEYVVCRGPANDYTDQLLEKFNKKKVDSTAEG